MKWKARFSADEFKSPDGGDARFREAVEAGIVRITEVDRLKWLRLWVHVGRRHREGHVRTPGAVFRDRVLSGQWDGSDADEDVARKFIKRQSNARPQAEQQPQQGDDPAPIGDILNRRNRPKS